MVAPPKLHKTRQGAFRQICPEIVLPAIPIKGAPQCFREKIRKLAPEPIMWPLRTPDYVCVERYIEFHPRMWVLSSANSPIVFINFRAQEPPEVIVLCSIDAWMDDCSQVLDI